MLTSTDPEVLVDTSARTELVRICVDLQVDALLLTLGERAGDAVQTLERCAQLLRELSRLEEEAFSRGEPRAVDHHLDGHFLPGELLG